MGEYAKRAVGPVTWRMLVTSVVSTAFGCSTTNVSINVIGGMDANVARDSTSDGSVDGTERDDGRTEAVGINGHTEASADVGAISDGNDSGLSMQATPDADSGGCAHDEAIGSCATGTVAYRCVVGQPPPEASDRSLVCSEPSAAGNVDMYCCYTTTTPAPATSTCAQDFAVAGCVPGSYGFSCTGADTPDQDYSNLTCSAGTPGAGATLYCCTH